MLFSGTQRRVYSFNACVNFRPAKQFNAETSLHLIVSSVDCGSIILYSNSDHCRSIHVRSWTEPDISRSVGKLVNFQRLKHFPVIGINLQPCALPRFRPGADTLEHDCLRITRWTQANIADLVKRGRQVRLARHLLCFCLEAKQWHYKKPV